MSDSDSFINEVTEEVRRDRLFGLMRRYGWIAVLAVFVLVGGAAWNEWSKAKERRVAENFGDTILAAMNKDDRAERAAALAQITSPDPASRGVLDMLTAAEQSESDPAAAATRLLALADSDGVELIYRQIAILKAVAIPDSGLTVDERRTRLEGLTLSVGISRLLAEEQLALIEIETGDTAAAIDRLQQIIADAGATAGLRSRASQVIVALGGELSVGQESN